MRRSSMEIHQSSKTRKQTLHENTEEHIEEDENIEGSIHIDKEPVVSSPVVPDPNLTTKPYEEYNTLKHSTVQNSVKALPWIKKPHPSPVLSMKSSFTWKRLPFAKLVPKFSDDLKTEKIEAESPKNMIPHPETPKYNFSDRILTRSCSRIDYNFSDNDNDKRSPMTETSWM